MEKRKWSVFLVGLLGAGACSSEPETICTRLEKCEAGKSTYFQGICREEQQPFIVINNQLMETGCLNVQFAAADCESLQACDAWFLHGNGSVPDDCYTFQNSLQVCVSTGAPDAGPAAR